MRGGVTQDVSAGWVTVDHGRFRVRAVRVQKRFQRRKLKSLRFLQVSLPEVRDDLWKARRRR